MVGQSRDDTPRDSDPTLLLSANNSGWTVRGNLALPSPLA